MGKYKSGGFYWERTLYQSKAFLSLNKNALKVLIALYDSRKQENQSKAIDRKGGKRKPVFINLDRLEMPYNTLIKVYNMNQQGIVRGIDELLAKGFIKISHHGGLGEHDKNRYALIDDYLRWEPEVIFRTRERDVRRGYQGKMLGATKKHAHKIIPLNTHENHTLSEDNRTQNHTLKKSAFSFVGVE